MSNDGCTCQCCGNKFYVDLVIPDDLWVKISPKKSSSGLLCGVCIMKRLEKYRQHGYLNCYTDWRPENKGGAA